MSFCDRAIELGLDRHDGLVFSRITAVNRAPGRSGSPASSNSTSFASIDSQPHPHIQQQPHHNMPTLITSATALPMPAITTIAPENENQIGIPPCLARDQDHVSSTVTDSTPQGNSCSGADSIGNAVSPLTASDGRDGTITIVIEEPDLYALGTSADTTQASDDVHDYHTKPFTLGTGNPCQGSSLHSKHTRKSLPPQWLPTSRGPNLATAQRAKEREHKKGSVSSSPADTKKSLRGTHSSVDLNRSEYATFLTKEALAAVDSSITSPPSGGSPVSPTKSQRLAWASPTPSPRNSSSYLSSKLQPKLPPAKQVEIDLDMVPAGHKCRPSSAATSTGDTVFNTANGSPVRSSADSDGSFKTVAECFENDDRPTPLTIRPYADQDVKQTVVDSDLTSATPFSSTVRIHQDRPRLSLDIKSATADKHVKSSPFTVSPGFLRSTGTESSLHSCISAHSASRIPRAASSAASSPRDCASGSPKKRSQPLKSSLASSQVTEKYSSGLDPSRTPLTPTSTAVRHVRTVNSVGATPIIIQETASEEALPEQRLLALLKGNNNNTGGVAGSCSDNPISFEKRLNVMIHRHDKASPPVTGSLPVTPTVYISSEEELDSSLRRHGSAPERLPRTPSNLDDKVASLNDDLAIRDPAIISCRKKSEPSEALIMNGSDESESIPMSPRKNSASIYPLNMQEKESMIPREGSTLSHYSGISSDLRADAPEFVPLATVAPSGDPTYGSAAYQSSLFASPWFAPGFYPGFYATPGLYEYSLLSAYYCRVQEGRSNSKRKARHSKKQSSASVPAKVKQNTPTPDTLPVSAGGSQEEITRDPVHPAPSATTVEPSAKPQQASPKSESGKQAQTQTQAQSNADPDLYDAFAAQMEIIDRHSPRNKSKSGGDANPVDITSIRNVPSTNESQYMKQNTMPRQRHGQQIQRRKHNHSDNGLYNTRHRNSTSVPIEHIQFPQPIAPIGRALRPGEFRYNTDTRAWYGSGFNGLPQNCGQFHVTFAAEQPGGMPCNNCYPGRPPLQ